jgi:hypothetical protein
LQIDTSLTLGELRGQFLKASRNSGILVVRVQYFALQRPGRALRHAARTRR